MSKMITQIYEIQDAAEAEKMIELGVDNIGSVLLNEKSWKQPSILEVMKITDGTKTINSLIPLFNTPDIIYAAIDYYRPQIIHFCESLVDSAGRKSDYSALLKLQKSIQDRYKELQIMRSIPIAQTRNPTQPPTLEIAKEFEDVSHIFLTDTWLGKEPVEGFIGITGKTCNWDVAAKLVRCSKIPVILAGGLSEKNVGEGIAKVRPFGVDSCMQTNAVDQDGKPIRFKKDTRKVREFVRIAKTTFRQPSPENRHHGVQQ